MDSDDEVPPERSRRHSEVQIQTQIALQDDAIRRQGHSIACLRRAYDKHDKEAVSWRAGLMTRLSEGDLVTQRILDKMDTDAKAHKLITSTLAELATEQRETREYLATKRGFTDAAKVGAIAIWSVVGGFIAIIVATAGQWIVEHWHDSGGT